MMAFLVGIYRFCFARPIFASLNKFVLLCGMSGLGIMNYGPMTSTGESRFLRRLMARAWKHSTASATPIVLDIGANAGDFSEAIVSNQPEARVFAFEPHPKTFARLLGRSLPRVECINSAVGSSVGVISLYDTSLSGGSEHASTIAGVLDGVHHQPVESEQVPLITIDAFLQERGIPRIDLLKIDVEGAELEILKGAMGAIKAGNIDVIQFEFNEMNVLSRVFFRDFWHVLDGYSFYRLLPFGLFPIRNYRTFFCELFAFQNIVAVRSGVAWPH
jgi:FkbM family methyltransferase